MLRDLLENGSPIDIFATFIALALIAASMLCLVFIIVGGISFILSAGNEEKIKKAVHTIRFAIIGLFVTFIAFFAVSWIMASAVSGSAVPVASVSPVSTMRP
jgi:hypothetical protein